MMLRTGVEPYENQYFFKKNHYALNINLENLEKS